MHKNAFAVIFLIILFLILLPASVTASGAQEDSYATAEALVEQREYNQALLVLTELLRTNPNRMDDVQALLSRIRIEKELYNDKYEELIEVYGGDDVEAAYPMIAELEAMDPNPNDATRISLVLARETAGFVFNNNRWVQIMEDASAQLSAADYSSAVETYMSGFDLSRLIFRDAGYGNIVVNEVFERADVMNKESLEFLELYQELIEKSSEMSNFFNLRNVDAYGAAVQDSYGALARTAEIRESLKDTADYFIVQEENIRNLVGDDKQIHYLIYMDRLLNGRTTVEEAEGISGAIELFWNSIFKNMLDESFAYTEEVFSDGLGLYNTGDYEAAGDVFADVLKTAESSIGSYEFGENYFESDAQFVRDGILSADIDEYEIKKNYLAQASGVSEEFPLIMEKRLALSGFEQRISEINGEVDGYRDIAAEIKSELSVESLEISSLLTEWEVNLSEISANSVEGNEISEKSIAAAKIPVEEYGAIEEGLLRSEIILAASVGNIDLDSLRSEYETVAAEVEESISLIEGVADDEAAPEVDEVDFTVLYKYPDQALARLSATENVIENLINGINTLDIQIQDERPEIRLSSELQTVTAASEDLMKKALSLLDTTLGMADDARDQIFTAEKLKQEGERRIEESRLLTQRAQFTAAKERLEQAAAKFDESLSYLEDTVLRTYRDNEIPRLYEEIQVAENNLVVKQVREYLTSGKASYSQGNFPAAQSVLIRAQSRWSDTNVEPNPEVEYWLTLTQTALSVTSGRVIAATDPLYTEMNQFLNQAQEDFQQARNLYDDGDGSEADVYFARAEQSILYVQQFFPFNEEARVLNLRISQYRDPEQFEEIFGDEFRTARGLISSNPQKAYIDLKDLEVINSDYPGLQSAITEAEYASGIKVRPPDPAKLARSSELYDLAYDIVSRNIRSEFTVALSYLDEAISLNPNNDEAIRLKDRISTDVGGTATAVLSNTDQQLYNEAVSEYTSGNYLKARIIVENLLKDPDNSRNPKLLDLQERIERTR
ncbi:MAG: hypothetical protein PQJ61_02285 [Spirochaetales bacterium]|uniref:Tetratricopeptide repeat protein n=1 Tax=Candidatus Thalassospirochaeta sargassi TaxID=3119039 RepID=A0AAJ1MHT6_9SPIO|nr:hypothetical protein [Spirochaetales bacterium]